MKKISSLLLMAVLFLTSCKDEITTQNVVDKYIEKTSQMSSYTSEVKMDIYRGDKTVSFDVGVSYLSPSYYKVSFVNKDNSSEQILIRNDEGVFALTPSLNKQYKFESNWPDNTSHVYLANKVCEIIKSDSTTEVILKDDCYEITSKINETEKYCKQICLIDKTSLELKSVCFTDDNNNILAKATYNLLGNEKTLIKNDFNVNKVMEDTLSSNSEGSVVKIEGELNVMYVLDGCNESKTIQEDKMVINYSGESNYTIICQDVVLKDSICTDRLYEEVDFDLLGMLFFNENSVTTFFGDKEVTIISDGLSKEVMYEILDSITFA